jgi:predicted ester cyclase
MSHQNKDVVEKYLGALSGKSKPPEVVDQFVSDQALKDHIAFFETAFPEYELILEDMIAEGDKIAIRVTFKGTHNGDLGEIPATHKSATLPVLLIYRIQEKKIVEHWMGVDQLDLMKQLGVM